MTDQELLNGFQAEYNLLAAKYGVAWVARIHAEQHDQLVITKPILTPALISDWVEPANGNGAHEQPLPTPPIGTPRTVLLSEGNHATQE